MPTIMDIAKAAGVSHATVSNVLNKKPGVSSEKIRLVENTARELGYRIDEQASLLRKGTTRTVAVILPNIRSARYCDLYTGILKSLESRNYVARLFLTDNLPYKEQQALNSAVAAKACSILIVPSLPESTQKYQLLSLPNTPVVFLERENVKKSIPCFSLNYRNAGRELAGRAKSYGYRHPYVLTGNLMHSTNKDFLNGIRDVYTSKSISCSEMKYGQCSGDAYLPFLNSHPGYDCFITSGSEIAEQIYNAYHTVGTGKELPVFTLSSLRAVPDSRFNILSMNYASLGETAANAVLDSRETDSPLKSFQMKASGFRKSDRRSSSHSQVRLKMLSLSSPSAIALNCLMQEFTLNTGIHVELETYPLSTIYNHILSGKALNWDVIRLDVSSFDFVAPHILTPLTDIDSDAGKQFDRFLPGLKENYGYVDNLLFAFPFDISTQMLFYRRDLFDNIMQTRSYYEMTRKHLEVPKTFREYNEIARFFTRKIRQDSPTKYGTSMALGTASSTASEFLVRLLGMGGDLYSPNGLLHISNEEARAALENYIALCDYADPDPVSSWSDIADRFVKGNMALTILFSNHASRIIRTENALSPNQVGFAPVPGNRPLLGGGVLGISQGSKHKAEAYQFIEWVTGDEIASRLMIMGGISPCKSAYENYEILNAYPWLRNFEANLQKGCRKTILSSKDLHIDLHSIEVRLGQLIIDFAAGRRSVDETIWRAQQLIEDFGEKT